MATARSGIDQLLEDIMKVEQNLKKQYGKTAGHVRIANARTTASYCISKSDDFMRWHIEYLNNLKSQL